MTTPSFQVGNVVRNPKTPQWGRGEIVAVDGAKVHVIFEHKEGTQAQVLQTTHVALELVTHGGHPMRRLPAVKKVGTRYVLDQRGKRETLAGLWEFFERSFPNGGFEDPDYVGADEGTSKLSERNSKVAAHQLVADTILSAEGRGLVDAGKAEEVSRRLRSAVTKTNLVAPKERVAFADALKAAAVAVPYARALLAFVDAPTVDQKAFAAYRTAVLRLPPDGRVCVDTWPALTLLPYLAQPDRHMFLKPDVTQLAAGLLGEGIRFQADPNWLTYKRLLDFSGDLLKFLQPHGARDHIDVQSFLWVVTKYTAEAPPVAAVPTA